MNMTLADELFLLAYDEDGAAPGGSTVDHALSGALLMELALAGRVAVTDGKVTVTDTRPTGDDLVDGPLARIAAEPKPRKPDDWVRRLSSGVRVLMLSRMVEAGVLRSVEDKVLWVFPRTRYPSATGAEPAAETETRSRLRAALDGAGPVDPRTAALCALVRAARMEKQAFPGQPVNDVRRRLKALGDANWPADAVRKAVEAVDAAMVAVFAATIVVTSAPS